MTKAPAPHEAATPPRQFENVNLFTSDVALQEALAREGGGHAHKELVTFGEVCGARETLERARIADAQPPRLIPYNAYGRRIDRIEQHPAHQDLLEMSCSEGLHCAAGSADAGSRATSIGRQVARAAGLYLAAQADVAHCQAISMTQAAAPIIASEPELPGDWLNKVKSRAYDRRDLPASAKTSVLIGFGVGESLFGGEPGAIGTRADASGGPGDRRYRISGHKWFLSAPGSDAFLILAQAPGGLSCFLLPRLGDDGHSNGLSILRLKDKLGTRGTPCAEVEIHDALGWLIGEEGQGEAVFAEAQMQLRLDAAIVSAGAMRRAVAEAITFVESRTVDGRALIEQPLMSHVLADLALDAEAAMALALRLARSFDRAEDARAAAWRRLMTPITKFLVCKIAPSLIAEAIECVGGTAYAEDFPLARLYRDVPANMLWEGTGNHLATEVLRVLRRHPEAAETVMDELAQAVGEDAYLEAAHARIAAILCEPRLLDVRARSLVEGLAVLAAGTILRAHAPAAVSDAFIATRMGSVARQAYGQELDWADTAAILRRASPVR